MGSIARELLPLNDPVHPSRYSPPPNIAFDIFKCRQPLTLFFLLFTMSNRLFGKTGKEALWIR